MSNIIARGLEAVDEKGLDVCALPTCSCCGRPKAQSVIDREGGSKFDYSIHGALIKRESEHCNGSEGTVNEVPIVRFQEKEYGCRVLILDPGEPDYSISESGVEHGGLMVLVGKSTEVGQCGSVLSGGEGHDDLVLCFPRSGIDYLFMEGVEEKSACFGSCEFA